MDITGKLGTHSTQRFKVRGGSRTVLAIGKTIHIKEAEMHGAEWTQVLIDDIMDMPEQKMKYYYMQYI